MRSTTYIRKIVHTYSLFATLNLIILILMPLLTNKLPFNSWYPFDVHKANYRYYLAWLFQFGCGIFAGGSNIAVNMYIYSVLVCVEFCLNLLGMRLMGLGHKKKQMAWSNQRETVTLYREMVELILLHIQIDR